MRRFALLLTLSLSLSSVASAYYHWTFFAQRSGPFQALKLRFDLNALPDSTLRFFIAQQGPKDMVVGDSFAALVSQIRRAGETWNVAGSALQLKFGGFQSKSFLDAVSEQAVPAVDVVFDDDLPPGVLALSEPLTYTDLSYLRGAQSPGFLPIVRSRLQLASDLLTRGQASYSEAFFLTIVHEFGHTLGLQHSMAAGAMATSITRSTSKAAPLAADDIAGLASLYPTAEYRSATGAIAGRVNVGRNGANLASVVALSLDGTAIGSMTQPDGSYRIEGLPPGEYLLYTHPLPPTQTGESDPAGISPPRDLARASFPATMGFQTRFYPATKDWREATHIKVEANATVSAIDFTVQPNTGANIYNLRMFGYLGARQEYAVQAAPLPAGYTYWLAFHAPGVYVGNGVVPGLQVSAVGDAAKLGEAVMPFKDSFALIAPVTNPVTRATPVAVTLTAGDSLYVRPHAFSVVPSAHPSLSEVTAGRDAQNRPVVVLAGENLGASTRVLFDGAEAVRVDTNPNGTLSAIAPPYSEGRQAVVELLGPDGQTSSQVRGNEPPKVWVLGTARDTSYSVFPAAVLAGTSAMVEIRGNGTNFLAGDTLAGETRVGFGSSDLSVRQMWVLAPDRILLNVTVHPKIALGAVALTISTGLELVSAGAPLLIQAADAKQLSVQLPVIVDGSTLAVRVPGLTGESVTATLGGVPAPVGRTEDGRVPVTIPSGTAAGPQILQLSIAGALPVPPVLVQINPPPTLAALPQR